MKTTYSLKRLFFKIVLVVGLIMLLIRCGRDDDWVKTINMETYINHLGVNLKAHGTVHLLIIPLSGCDQHTQPLYTVLEEPTYSCQERNEALIIFDGDYTHQLAQQTSFKRDSLLDCMIFDPQAGGFKAGLVGSSPIYYRIVGGKIKQTLTPGSMDWGPVLNRQFGMRLIRPDEE